MKILFVPVFLLGMFLFFGCSINIQSSKASLSSSPVQSRQLTEEELTRTEILGSVNITFVLPGTGTSGIAMPPTADLDGQAYSKLLEEARKTYSGNIDIRNITVSQNGQKQISNRGIGFMEDYEFYYTATGSVVTTSASARATDRLDGITNQILNAFRGNRNVTIAIFDFVNINGKTSVLGRYLVEQISNHFFQNSDLKIVERAQIDRVFREQNFGMSGNVSDESAARIGHMLGANAVTIGTLTRVGNKISVNIKIVDAETASILSSGSTEIDGTEYIEMYNELLE